MPYHNALYYELACNNLQVSYNAPFSVHYRCHTVGEYFADLLVNGTVILEVKAVSALSTEHAAQLLNYLHISGCRLGFLLNFAPQRLEVKRLVL
ncbi:GxxExxY protein [Marispirochaeta sp.]|uniref:GxxExxY protein n=1 Tax=Marispirochaeta sp. TaxID=2038653 RepID=UPI0029C88BE7|nr:GxxExxY protein [Marispirochaeta sp.]